MLPNPLALERQRVERAKTPDYRIELCAGKVRKGTWWKPTPDYTTEPANVWWVTGGGVSRPATDVEIYLQSQIEKLTAQVVEVSKAYGKERSRSIACGADFEHTSAKCELPTGHAGNHVTRTDGGALIRPQILKSESC